MAKGFSLHIGIDDLCDPPCNEPDLEAAVFDAEAMAHAATNANFSSAVLPDRKAKRKAVLGWIEATARHLTSGDYVVITCDGYGISLITNGPHPATYRGWMLADGSFLFRDLFRALRAFATGVRILVVSNTCNSGSVVGHPAGQPVVREVTQQTAADLLEAGDFKFRFEELNDVPMNDPTIIHLTACALDETVDDADPGTHTAFNEAFVDLITDGIPRTFDEFVVAIRGFIGVRTVQKEPVTVSDPRFEQLGPFVIA
jgi:hypothetical protein